MIEEIPSQITVTDSQSHRLTDTGRGPEGSSAGTTAKGQATNAKGRGTVGRWSASQPPCKGDDGRPQGVSKRQGSEAGGHEVGGCSGRPRGGRLQRDAGRSKGGAAGGRSRGGAVGGTARLTDS